ncbi:TLDc domain-containing protein [Entamoeba marina]
MNLVNTINAFVDMIKNMEKEANEGEIEEIKELLEKCDVDLGDYVDVEERIKKYESFYSEVSEFIRFKKDQITTIEKKFTSISGLSHGKKFVDVINKKKENINMAVDCLNHIVERIKNEEQNKGIEPSIYNKRIKDLESAKVSKYCQLDLELNNSNIQFVDKMINENQYKIIFDSDIDGDGGNNVLYQRVLNKSNLYFLSFDNEDNVFGGYVKNTIYIANQYLSCENAFIFSLIRNGYMETKRYNIKKGREDNAFQLYKDQAEGLYRFGGDITIRRVGCHTSCCDLVDYEYDKKQPLTNKIYPFKYEVMRIIVVQMK